MAYGPWDNAQLANPPNNPAYLQAFAQLMNSTGTNVNNAFKSYQEGQNFANQQTLFPYQLKQAQQQQELSDLFKGGVPTLPNGNPDYSSIVKSMIQTGGAGTAGQMLPLLSQIQGNQTAQTIANGGQPQQTQRQPTAVYGVTGTDTGNVTPRAAIRQPGDDSEETSLNTLAAQYHVDPKAFLQAYPGFKPLLNKDLTDDQIGTVSSRMSKFKQTVREQNPISQSGDGDQEGDRQRRAAAGNELNPSTGEGSTAITPRPPAERRLQQTAQAPQPAIKEQGRLETGGGYQPPSGAEIKRIFDEGQAKLRAAQTFGLQSTQGQAFRDEGNKLIETANQQRKEREDWFKQTDPRIIGAAAAKAGAEDEEKKRSSTLEEFAKEGLDMRGHKAQLDTIDKLGQKVGYGVIPKMQSFLGQHGIETKGLGDIQAYERAIDYMAPQLRPIGSGRLMQQELTAFKSSLGGLMTTPEGRKISVENLGLIADYKEKIGQIAADTRLSTQQRMDKIYNLPPPHLKTMEDIAPDKNGEPAPMPGARKAPDGKWYVPDPNRQGKYLMVQ